MDLEKKQLDLNQIKQQYSEQNAMVKDLQQIDPALDFLDKLTKAQEVAMAHGRLEDATKITNSIGMLAYRKELTDSRKALSEKQRIEGEAKEQDSVFKAVGVPQDEEGWNSARMMALSMHPNLPEETRKMLQQPWSPGLKQFLENRSMDPAKRAELDQKSVESDARVRADQALEQQRLATAERTAKLLPYEVGEKRAATYAHSAAADLSATRARIETERLAAEAKNGGKNVPKLIEPTKEDRVDTEDVLKQKFPEGLGGSDMKAARVYLAAEAKKIQTQDRSDFGSALRKALVKNDGLVYVKSKSMFGKPTYAFKEMPTDLPAGFVFKGRVSPKGNRVFENKDGQMLEDQ
jgi:hypothetical protein